VLLAGDRRGERWGSYLLNWDSHRAKGPQTIARDLGILPCLAEEGMAAAAKDVSNAGIVGSLAMLLEGAGLGAVLDLDRLEVPPPFTMEEWLKIYPSYGYLLITDTAKVPGVRERFQERGIWADAVGRTDDSGILRLRSREEEAVFIDFSRQSVFSSSPGGKRP
jgi:selenophosphate synthetase-related protein